MRVNTRRISFGAVLLVLCCTARLAAQDATNVLLVVNEASPASQEIAAHYAAARRISSDNVAHVQTAIIDEIDRAHYEAEIERPLAEWIARRGAQDRILYIVLTKGMPLRIRGTGGLEGTTASVDSELSLLYRRLVGTNQVSNGRTPNPYFAAAAAPKAFTHTTADIYLVTRLDGFTVADVIKMIDRGLVPSRDGAIVLDQRASLLGDKNGDAWLAEAAQKLAAAGLGSRVVLNTGSDVVTGRTGLLGYYSWGSNDAGMKMRRLGLGFVPGALAAMFVSTDARTFKEPPDTWALGKWVDARTFFAGSPQSLTGDLIREGATGVAGHVAEPYLDATIRPQILFPAYVSGLNLAESFYSAMPYLSWQTVVVGDPLCAPFRTTNLTPAELYSGVDPETDLPRLFSTRRRALLATYGVKPDIAKLLLKADSRLTRGDLAGGTLALEELVAIDPTLNGANLVLASIYELGKDYPKAAERYRAILATRPDDVRALNNLAYLLAVNQNSPGEALPLAERAYKMAAGKDLAKDFAFSLATNALPFSERAFDIEASHARIADTYGWTQHLVGQNAVADTLLAEAVPGDPQNAVIQLHVAVVKEALGQREAAAAALKRSLELDPRLDADAEVKRLTEKLKTP